MTTYAEKLLPHDVEAEEAVLGSILIDGECLTRLVPLLKEGAFYRERNQLCFDAALSLFQRDQAVDQVTLAGELARTEKLVLVGGMAYLSHLVSITPTSVHAEDYAQVISRTSSMRRLIDAGNRIIDLGYADTEDIEATMRQAEDALFTVRGTGQPRSFVPLKEIYDQYLQEQASAAADAEFSGMPIMSGFPDLDEYLGGLQRADLIILGARPSMGKSSLASEAKIDSHRLRLGLYTHMEEDRIIDSTGRLSDLPVFIDDTSYQGMVEMRSKASLLALERGLDLLVVDYLQLVQGKQKWGQSNRVQEITEISRELKVLAGDLKVALIACSQLNRMVENRPNNRPRLSDLRDSGSIEQDADVVMFIHREDVYTTEEEWTQTHPGQEYPKNIAEIIIAKHRKGPTGSIRLEFVDNLVRFDSV